LVLMAGTGQIDRLGAMWRGRRAHEFLHTPCAGITQIRFEGLPGYGTLSAVALPCLRFLL